jgi:hypothetical protein
MAARVQMLLVSEVHAQCLSGCACMDLRLHGSTLGGARIEADVLRKWIIRPALIGHHRLPRSREVLRILDGDAILERISRL